jgi:Leucine-rich repeat (LRR) protein
VTFLNDHDFRRSVLSRVVKSTKQVTLNLKLDADFADVLLHTRVSTRDGHEAQELELSELLRKLEIGGSGSVDLGLFRDFISLKALAIQAPDVCNVARLPDGLLHKLTKLEALELTNLGPFRDLGPDIVSLCNLRELNISRSGVGELSFVKHLTSLVSLDCSYTPVSSLEPLRGVHKLQYLNMKCAEVEDLRPIAGLTSLVELEVGRRSDPLDLRGVAELVNLKELCFQETIVEDLRPLQNLLNLETLIFYECFGVGDLSPLRKLSKLKYLHCGMCPEIVDFSPLEGLVNLESLECYSTGFADLRPIMKMRKLRHLSCHESNLTSLACLGEEDCELVSLETIHMYGTSVGDLRPLEKLPNLVEVMCLRAQFTAEELERFERTCPRVRVSQDGLV